MTTSRSSRILVVEDRASMREFLVAALERAPAGQTWHVDDAADGDAALRALEAVDYDLVLTDLKLPGADGLEVLARAKAVNPDVVVIVLTAFGTIETAVDAMRRGAEDFLTKPVESPDALRLVVSRALDNTRLRRENERLRADSPVSPAFDDIVHRSAAMRRVIDMARAVARQPTTVLLVGESGTGKELFARAIHREGSGTDAPFVAVNCAALPENLLESELFGHEKGAFTGATALRRGRFELARHGTLFLDEIGEMALALQAKLLRVLQEGTFERVGGGRSLQSDARVVAATNRDLPAMVRERTFREDLYYRLAVFPVRIPPLRERRDDIDVLVTHALARLARRSGRRPLVVDPDAAEALRLYDWPGNVRELHNVLERSTILAIDDRLTVDLLPVEIGAGDVGHAGGAPTDGTLANLERDAIERALTSVGGNRRLAAEKLGISVRTLQYRIKEYGLSGRRS